MATMKLVLLLAVSTVSTASARLILPGHLASFTAPDFYHDRKGPHFKNLTRDEPYEVRAYKASTWAAINSTDGFLVTETKTYAALTRYFKGANEKSEHFDLTTPAVTVFTPTDADFSGSKDEYTVGFFLAGKAPKPAVDGVFIKDLHAATAYVRSFGGYATESTILGEAKTLRDQLLHDKVDFIERSFVSANYDTAARLFNRHNEVWFFAAPAGVSMAVPKAVTDATEQFQAAAGSLVDAVYHKMKAMLG